MQIGLDFLSDTRSLEELIKSFITESGKSETSAQNGILLRMARQPIPILDLITKLRDYLTSGDGLQREKAVGLIRLVLERVKNLKIEGE